MKIWLVEPYLTGSHQAWAEGYRQHSRHQVRLLALPGRFWKWRMQGGAITLARQAQALDEPPNVILASDMLNVPTFLTLAGTRLSTVPIALYFHENQLTYPLQPGEKRDLHYGFINLASALRADQVYFNSSYHLEAFLDELPRLLKHCPDYTHLETIQVTRAKASVLPVGCDLARFDRYAGGQDRGSRRGIPPLILWNQRWEYDKDPETMLRALYALMDEGIAFRVALAGENFRQRPEEFAAARARLGERLVHFGFAENAADYARLLWEADVVLSTAIHEFFGVSVVEAVYCGATPVLPRRLSYPELIPAGLHAQCLYDDFAGLLVRLKVALADRAPCPELRAAAARFDWSVLGPVYDDLMEGAAEARG